jgi:hypothetical protein
MDEGRFSVSAESVYNQLGCAAAPLRRSSSTCAEPPVLMPTTK